MSDAISRLKAINKIDIGKLRERQSQFTASMENIPKTDPWVPIYFGTQLFKLEYSFGAVRNFFRETGRNLNTGDIQMEDLADMELMVAVLLAGLKTHHPELTGDDVADLISMKHRVYYAHTVVKALEATQPDMDQVLDAVGDMQDAISKLEGTADETPLPEIVPSPISGGPVVQ